MRRTLLSPAAERVLSLLTPEFQIIDEGYLYNQAIDELTRMELIDIAFNFRGTAIRLSKNGYQFRPDMHN
jgi:hypothetical protein